MPIRLAVIKLNIRSLLFAVLFFRLLKVKSFSRNSRWQKEVGKMLGLVLTFLIIAIAAGILGFGIIAGMAAFIAKVLFFLFLVGFVISLLFHWRRV